MIIYCVDQWDKNRDKLLADIRENITLWNEFSYKKIVEKVVEIIFNNDEDDLDSDNYNYGLIKEINDGDYQGTLLYLIPLRTYQPSAHEYLMTYVDYGSCSGCDTLQSIQNWSWGYMDDEIDMVERKQQEEQFIEDMMKLCLHLVQNTIKPYNSGWRKDDKYNEVESSEI
jgi:hypothetical protein